MEHHKREQMAVRQKAAKGSNCQILIFVWKCRQQLVIPFEVIHLATFCSQPYNSTALMTDLFCFAFLRIKSNSSAEKEQRLKMGRPVSLVSGTEVRSCWLQDAGSVSGDIEHEKWNILDC